MKWSSHEVCAVGQLHISHLLSSHSHQEKVHILKDLEIKEHFQVTKSDL
jgi:hypothetical protein